MDHVFSTTQRLIGYVPAREIWEMTPKHWNTLMKGARHRMIDMQELQITGAVAMARMNNGKDIKALMRDLKEHRTLIDKTEDQHEYDKEVKLHRRKHINREQKADLEVWVEKVKEMQNR